MYDIFLTILISTFAIETRFNDAFALFKVAEGSLIRFAFR